MSLKELTAFIVEMGGNHELVTGSGGNASYKTARELFITPSGSTLSEIEEGDFLKLNRSVLQQIFMSCGSVNKQAMKSVLCGALEFNSENLPSIDTLFHEIIDFPIVVHLHPQKVNALTCSKNGAQVCADLFPNALWVEKFTIGSDLAVDIKNTGKKSKVVFLRNHGLILAGNNVAEIKNELNNIMTVLNNAIKVGSGASANLPDKEFVLKNAPILRSLLRTVERKSIVSRKYSKLFSCALTPEHYLFAGSHVLELEENANIQEELSKYRKKYEDYPKLISIKDKVTFCCSDSYADARLIDEYLEDAEKIIEYAESFGGITPLTDQEIAYIDAVLKTNTVSSELPELFGKIAVVTGGAQGFGYGISEGLVKKGATVAIADLNIDGASSAAEALNSKYGKNKVFALQVNIADEDSVKKMVENLVLQCGGLDLLVANAGVLKAGSVKTFAKKDWDFVTDVNYTGYYLCVKYTSNIMAIQNEIGGSWTDIVQINSKSGLAGSNRNAAYAGSKFGTIGLTQSFALELVEDKIKVNSVCPGNFFDGPLWSDPERGLFVQYLNSNKVPGAKSLEDVKRFYESKVPMNRGCFPDDVVKAIIYCVLQKYETGQAVPVSGGQVMLN